MIDLPPVDLEKLDHGPATAALRHIMTAWQVIRWFAPACIPRAEANRLFTAHHNLGRAYAPALFAESVQFLSATGDWADFSALCSLVQNNTKWDWKYAVLKRLTAAHAAARSWDSDSLVAGLTDGTLSPGNLFYRLHGHTFWTCILRSHDFPDVPEKHRNAARFYESYCAMDLIACLEWQLAEGHADITDNPFVPLLRCYAAGYYPFVCSADSVVMFAFAGAA